MYNTAHVYDLSFVAPTRKPRTKPQIVFTLDEELLSELNNRLQHLLRRVNAARYCGREVQFWYPTPDLFGRIEFGFEKCGLMTKHDGDVSLRIELSEEMLFCSTLTINLLAHALIVPFEGRKLSNRPQLIDLETLCDRDRLQGYGHDIGGYVSGGVNAWLRKQGTQVPDDRYSIPVPEEVITAMRHAWYAVAAEDQKRWASECGGRIANDGRFMLECFGNACDVAIYPDNAVADEKGSVPFSCHNLDRPDQQITLIAGLAKLCELVRKEE
ncbi:MAG TPA: hypothetical protein VHD31_01455 [Candidatus Paceibacterota bacterium]|nr:hypothetical protein [Candidatus Paceibacterota bacterium]